MSSPTQRSLAKLRAEGWTAATVERWNPHVKIRQDLWGFGDLLCFKGDEVLIVQTTSGSNLLARVAKIRMLPVADDWLRSEHRKIVVHGWLRKGPRGKRKTWRCREVCVKRRATADSWELVGVEEDGDEIFTPKPCPLCKNQPCVC